MADKVLNRQPQTRKPASARLKNKPFICRLEALGDVDGVQAASTFTPTFYRWMTLSNSATATATCRPQPTGRGLLTWDHHDGWPCQPVSTLLTLGTRAHTCMPTSARARTNAQVGKLALAPCLGLTGLTTDCCIHSKPIHSNWDSKTRFWLDENGHKSSNSLCGEKLPSICTAREFFTLPEHQNKPTPCRRQAAVPHFQKQICHWKMES